MSAARPPEGGGTPGDAAPILAIEGLALRYGPVQALRGVDLALHAGRVLVLLGKNGAGKSSLVNTIAGLYRGQRGRIAFLGRDIHGWEAAEVNRAGIALVPEGRQVFPDLSVWHNLQVGAHGRPARGRVRDDLEQAFAWFPQLAPLRDRMAGLLSGGEQQMLAIARGLVSRPRLLLLDEPSLGLSPRLAHQLFALVRRIAAGTGAAVLLVEQNAVQALVCADEACVLEQGRIVQARAAAGMAGFLGLQATPPRGGSP